ncbi:MAG TPA: RluA family pseudouridine synthase [Terriglobales bacterium]|nr:RluA family pseudouridine synthase [Terriglobales bacterium]
MVQEILVPDSVAVKNIENFLKNRFPIGYVRKLFRKNGIRLNGKRARAEDPVHAGDHVSLYIPFEKKISKIQAQPTPPARFHTIFEDQDLWVIDKPPGLAVHEGKQVPKRRSLLGLLETKHRGAGVAPGLVHRLDKDTSGILIVAKNGHTAQAIEKAFAEGEVRKEYVCLVAGRLAPESGKIDFLLAGREGKPVQAVTRFKVTRRFSQSTLIRVTLETGRMHQIRQHCAKIGHPVVLDDRYGDFAFNKEFRRRYGLKRQFLHAATVAVPYKGRTWKWTAPLPRDLGSILTLLDAAEQR